MHYLKSLSTLLRNFYSALSLADTAWESLMFVQGTVSLNNKNMLTISNGPGPVALRTPVNIRARRNTEFKNVTSIEAIKTGDQVEIYFKVEKGLNIATSVQKIDHDDTHLFQPSRAN